MLCHVNTRRPLELSLSLACFGRSADDYDVHNKHICLEKKNECLLFYIGPAKDVMAICSDIFIPLETPTTLITCKFQLLVAPQ